MAGSWGSGVDAQGVRTSLAHVSHADRVVLVGLNPRIESPVLNLWLRESFLRDRVQVIHRGSAVDLTYPVTQRGLTSDTLTARAEGRHPRSKALAEAQRPRRRVGPSVRSRGDGAFWRSRRRQLARNREQHGSVVADWPVFQRLHPKASSLAAHRMGRSAFRGWSSTTTSTAVVLVHVGAADLREAGYPRPSAASMGSLVSRVSHGDELIAMSDTIVATPADLQTAGHYMNTEGRVQYAVAATSARGEDAAETRADRRLRRLKVLGGQPEPLPAWRSRSVVPAGRLAATQAGSSLVGTRPTRLTPAVHDYYREGHTRAQRSPTMAKASQDLGFRETFVG